MASALSGQDVRRGTFSHRHSVFYDTETRERHIPLNNLAEEQGNFCVYNSLLSEVAVLGFDYGYSLLAQNMLICWEAQFGDFVNGAQVILDQFISSAESKWQRPSHITLLLPHGFEGPGARTLKRTVLSASCKTAPVVTGRSVTSPRQLSISTPCVVR